MDAKNFWMTVARERMNYRTVKRNDRILISTQFVNDPAIILLCHAMQYDVYKVSRVVGECTHEQLNDVKTYWEGFESSYHYSN